MSEPLTQQEDERATERLGFWARVWGAIRLDASAFADVEADRSALGQALAVVLVAGAARGASAFRVEGVIAWGGAIAVGLALWLLAAALLASLGKTWLRAKTDWPEMLRTLGFAAAPLVFLAPVGLLPDRVRVLSELAIHGWAATAAIVAAREAFDVSTARAVVACALALGIAFALLALLGAGDLA